MATIRLIIYDDEGNEITTTQQVLASELDTIAKIESAVEDFRQQVLPQVSKTLLEQSQKVFKKK
jgi:hypothetical protein